MKVALRYVTARRNRDGGLRWYWIRRGQPMVRLPDEENARIRRAAELNQEADGGPAEPLESRGSIAWAIRAYRESEAYTGLSASSRRAYGAWMERLEKKQGARHLCELTRGNVKTLIASIPTPGGKRHMAAVLARVVEIARDHEYLSHNTTDRLRIPAPNKRSVIWTEADEAAFLEACEADHHRDAMRLALALLLYTGQRPGDVLRMTWAHYDGNVIRVVQQKTGARVEVACHRDLRALLDSAKKDAKGLTIVAMRDGRPWRRVYFTEAFGRIKARAGLPGHRAADCRRTAVMRLYEAGADEEEIAAITGHSVANAKNVLNDWYFVRSPKLAASGIAKLEQKKDSGV